MNILKSTLLLSTLIGSQCAFAMMQNAEVPPVTKESVKAETQSSRLIIKFKPTKEEMYGASIEAATNAVERLSQISNVNMTYVRPMSGKAHIVKLSEIKSNDELSKIIIELKKNPDILYVEIDRLMKIMRAPNDSLYNQQWHYHASSSEVGGANIPGAWDITTGSTSNVIAVIDTGILPHTDLAGKTVPGYDFISDLAVANDGDGRDANPSDPGDNSGNGSSWHGTHVAGTIGAATNNTTGVAGINWNGKILPVRVLGVGGGYTSDIVDGVRWSAGIPVLGVPNNANPAKVLNLSLGGSGACSLTWQSAVDDVAAVGAITVVAAGNSNADAADFSPASCNNVITVASNSQTGSRAYYSNYGSTVEITAPGGDQVYVDSGVLSTLDGGTDAPNNDNIYVGYQGTSMAAPHVAGIVSLMTDVNPSLNTSGVTSILASTARAFPTGTRDDCTTALCGAGIIDAYAAVTAANGGGSGSGITPTQDFTGNGYNDLVWHNYLNGATKVTSMEGVNSLGDTPIQSTANINLVVKAFADFNNDGNPDIVFHNKSTGQLRIWLMDGTTKVSNELVLNSSNINLNVIGAGDFTGDGNIDIAVHNTVTGALRIWQMDGNLNRTANISAVASSNTNLVGAGVGDLNADGKPDVLLHNASTGNVRAWLMNGITKVSNILVQNSSNTNLKVRGVVDIDADGKDDILWQNRSTGVVRVWKMDGTTKVSNLDLVQETDLMWDVGVGPGGEPTITIVTDNSSTPGSIDTGEQENWYKYTATETKLISVSSTGSTDTVGHIYDYALVQLQSNDDGAGYPNFYMEQDVVAGTTYFFKVRSFATDTGSYTLVVSDLVP